MKTGPTRNTTKELLVALDKHGKKNKSDFYRNLSKILSKPRRNRASINLWKLQRLAEKNQGKTIVVPGKVLGQGNLSTSLNVYALEYSDKAVAKISDSKGKALLLADLIKENPKASELMLVK